MQSEGEPLLLVIASKGRSSKQSFTIPERRPTLSCLLNVFKHE